MGICRPLPSPDEEGRTLELSNQEINQLVQTAHGGSEAAREQLLLVYRPFVTRAASRYARRFLNWENDDELSVALVALNEAIDSFKPDHEVSFTGFAQVVIRRRLVDFFREQARNQAIPSSRVGELLEQADTARVDEEKERGLELSEFGQRLQQFGLSLREIVQVAPTRLDAKKRLVHAARILVTNDNLLGTFYARGRLPLEALSHFSGVHFKALERGRKYLIAVIILLDGDYPYLQSYLQPLLEGVSP